MDRGYPTRGYGGFQPLPPPSQPQSYSKPKDYSRDSWSGGPQYGPDSGRYAPESDNRQVQSSRGIYLDDYNSDLNFNIEADGVTGGSHVGPGFDHMWGGARATHGVKSGKVCFEVTVLDKLPVNLPETETTPHVVRVGWSVDTASLQVGEDHLSYGYGGTAKCSVNNKFFDYGERYSSDDIITCYIDLDATPKCILYARNGLYLGVAFRLGPEAHNATFYPHVTVKNMRVRVNFGGQTAYFPPFQGFRMMQDLDPYALIPGTAGPATQRDCQVIMMVGLPGAGKTCWAEEYIKKHPAKKFHILGTNSIMDKMKVMGLMRKRNYHGRWDALIKQATDTLNKVLKIAEKKNRNYILDQTNVYPNARRRKMNNFRGFYKTAAVLVNTNEVLKQRTEKREKEEGKFVPEEAIMEMKANFTVPEKGEIFDDVWFVEESKESSEGLVAEFQAEGQAFKDAAKKRKPDDQKGNQKGDDLAKRQRVDQGPSQNTNHYKTISTRDDTRAPSGYSAPPIAQPSHSGYRNQQPQGVSGPPNRGPGLYASNDRVPSSYGPPGRKPNSYGPPDRTPSSFGPPRGTSGPDKYGASQDRYGSNYPAPSRYGSSDTAPDRYGSSSSSQGYNQSFSKPTQETHGYSSSYDSGWQGDRGSYGSAGSKSYDLHDYGGYTSQDTKSYDVGYDSGYGSQPQDYQSSGTQGYGYDSYGTSQQQSYGSGQQQSYGSYSSFSSPGYGRY